MARTLRIGYPGAICPVMNRGDHREPMFREDVDRRVFLETPGLARATVAESRVAHLNIQPDMQNEFNLVVTQD